MDFHSIIGQLRAIESLNAPAEEVTTEESAKCNMTEEGESCPVHGLEECPVTVSIPVSEEEDEEEESSDMSLDEFFDIPLSHLGGAHTGPDHYGYDDLRESINIVASTNVHDGQVKRNLTVTAEDEDAESLAALLQRAGLVGSHSHAHEPMQAVHVEPVEADACTCQTETMENADHDHGHEEAASAGEPVDVNDYTWEGPHTNQRFGKIGDNTLMAEGDDNAVQERVASLFSSLTEQYRAILEDADSTAGSMSPLSATDRDAFDKDPMSDEEPVTDGSHSPMSTIERQSVDK